MSYNYFMDKIEAEDKHMPLVIDFIQRLGYKLIRDVRKNPEYQKKDIDLLFSDSIFNEVAVEVKIRLKDYGDLLVESYSCFERKTKGNLYASEAYFYAYAIVENSKLKTLRLLHMPSLREWFDKSKQRYKPKYAPNPPENPVYHTEFYSVPLRDIPSHIFFVRGDCSV